MKQIYRRTPMSKCDFNKVAKQIYWNHTLPWVFYGKFATYFQNTFSQEYLWREFEKWLAIRASVSGVGGVIAWVAC